METSITWENIKGLESYTGKGTYTVRRIVETTLDDRNPTIMLLSEPLMFVVMVHAYT